jgi:hypothetical protein
MNDTTFDSFSRVREILRRRFPHLTDEDLEFAPGQEEALQLRLQQRTGESRETIAILLRAAGVNVPAPWAASDSLPHGNGNDLDHSRGSGIPDDTSRSGGRSI